MCILVIPYLYVKRILETGMGGICSTIYMYNNNYIYFFFKQSCSYVLQVNACIQDYQTCTNKNLIPVTDNTFSNKNKNAKQMALKK